MLLQRFKDAKEVIDRAISIDDSVPESWATLGSIDSDLGNDELALSSFNRAVQLSPSNHELYLQRAITLRKLGKFSEGIKDVLKAFEIEVTKIPAFFIDFPFLQVLIDFF